MTTTNFTMAARFKRAAMASAPFKRIVLPNPRQRDLFADFDRLRLVGIARKGKRQRGLRLLACTSSRKPLAGVVSHD